jgi:branched-chain amino acid transport system ATP-binding protein
MLLEAISVCKYFGGLKAVDGVNCRLQKGQIKSIIGPNGAGKTTFFNLIAGLFKPTSGQILFRGRDVTGQSVHQMARLGITKTFQITHVFPNLSVYENVRIAAQPKKTQFNFWGRVPRVKEVNRLALEILENIGLRESQDRLASDLSHGEKRYLEIGLALATQPELLLLDEPTAGMSPSETLDAKRFIKRIFDDLRLTIMLIEHDMSVVMDISHDIMVLSEGNVLAEGTPEEISGNELVQAVYLGAHRDAQN